jgi:hypothetical protein
MFGLLFICLKSGINQYFLTEAAEINIYGKRLIAGWRFWSENSIKINCNEYIVFQDSCVSPAPFM